MEELVLSFNQRLEAMTAAMGNMMDARVAAAQQQFAQQLAEAQHQFAEALHQQQPAAQPAPPSAADVAQPPVAADRALKSLGIKPKLPEFHGKLGADNVRLFQHKLNMAFNATGVTNDSQKLYIATACLRGAAEQWWLSVVNARGDAVANSMSWDEFCKLVEMEYLPVNFDQLLRTKLDGMRQHRDIHSYINEFRNIVSQLPDMAEADRIFAFIRGAKPNTAARLRESCPATLQEAIRAAERYDNAWYPSNTERRDTPSKLGADAMEIDALNFKPAADGERRIRCYNCNQWGTHISRNCPHPRADKNKPQGNGPSRQ